MVVAPKTRRTVGACVGSQSGASAEEPEIGPIMAPVTLRALGFGDLVPLEEAESTTFHQSLAGRESTHIRLQYRNQAVQAIPIRCGRSRRAPREVSPPRLPRSDRVDHQI